MALEPVHVLGSDAQLEFGFNGHFVAVISGNANYTLTPVFTLPAQLQTRMPMPIENYSRPGVR